MAKRKKPGSSILIEWLMLGFIVYTSVSIVNLQIQIKEKQESLVSLQNNIKQYENANQKLQKQMEAGISEVDIGEIARTELNYAEPGERVFVDTSRR